ncbi:hypothetical protein [Anaerotruncus sp. AF02-27]|uniref:hypothetical protein n=1 Tax=Anaerotruncus sp. AF02-27 TaxID=2292191 RepID=UPI0011C21AAC|nr:hypothetical protein [Anaerotruncus sp. AF02-27]
MAAIWRCVRWLEQQNLLTNAALGMETAQRDENGALWGEVYLFIPKSGICLPYREISWIYNSREKDVTLLNGIAELRVGIPGGYQATALRYHTRSKNWEATFDRFVTTLSEKNPSLCCGYSREREKAFSTNQPFPV